MPPASFPPRIHPQDCPCRRCRYPADQRRIGLLVALGAPAVFWTLAAGLTFLLLHFS